ncbi:hypothetical protein NK6_184 [Bradyrhizobium diazoefficiens]|uniref:Uncharacterized protein n=1 Tax=Bradyrhizobium diazoefficiens TaxID=1355477 RepID=A0A0E4BJK0_9BRAD|nr:hypothetical protein NK6_184 [Bradyrhizobium diazoefficiens]
MGRKKERGNEFGSMRGIGHQRQALTGTIIDDGQDAEAAAVGQLSFVIYVRAS